MLRFGLLGLVFCFLGCVSHTPPCLLVRAAFDVGSGATKMKVARVNLCKQQVEQILLSESEAVGYEADLKKESAFSPSIQEKGLQAFARLKAKAAAYQPAQWAGVATAAFRRATNAKEFLERVFKETGIPVRLISQELEALLGYRSGLSAHPSAPLVVWDIGGGSQQLTMMTPTGPLIYRGQIASEKFKNMILEKVQKSKAESPNPLSSRHVRQAKRLVRTIVAEIPEALKKALRDPGTTVVGIGGVHQTALSQQVGKKEFTAADINATLTSKLGLTDSQIGGAYASLMLSNMILVGGMMEQLEIPKVHAASVDLSEGLFITPEAWP